jgi:uncharacterized protein (DUF1330 family)
MGMKGIGFGVAGLAAGALLGAAAAAGQVAPPKGYLIAQFTVHDAKSFAAYPPQVPPILAKYGGHYIVRGGAVTPLEGTPPGQRVVVIEFENVAAASTFYHSPEYQKIAPIRQAASSGTSFVVEGVGP